jgi:hypothetical protein
MSFLMNFIELCLIFFNNNRYYSFYNTKMLAMTRNCLALMFLIQTVNGIGENPVNF